MTADWLFAYGTLRRPEVQRAVFGRVLRQTPDALRGFEAHQITLGEGRSRATYPILRRARGKGGVVRGAVLRVAAADLQAADAYEGGAYRRVRVKLDSGRSAFVYVDAAEG